jgi:hypothetical protein
MGNIEIYREVNVRLLKQLTRLGLTRQGIAKAIGAPRLSIIIHYRNGHSSPAAETLPANENAGINVRNVLAAVHKKPSGINWERLRIAGGPAPSQGQTRGWPWTLA